MKKFTALGLAFAASLLFVAPVFAAAGDTINNIDLCAEGGQFSAICKNPDIGGVLGTVVNLIFIIAIILAFGFLIFGGIKWITSGGDKSGVEAARGTIIAAIIGLIVVFLSYIILNLVLGLFGTNLNNLTLPKLGEQGPGDGTNPAVIKNACQDCGTRGNKACPASCSGLRCRTGRLEGNKCK